MSFVWQSWYERLIPRIGKYSARRLLISFELMFFSSRFGFALIVVLFQNYLLDRIIPLSEFLFFPLSLFGLAPITMGIIVDVLSIRAFLDTGKGTPAPMKPPERLVVAGPYEYLRNPMYLSLLFTLLGFAILFDSFILLIAAFALIVIIHFLVVLREEATLERRFGKEYADYKRNVPRWIPRLKVGRRRLEL